MTTKLPLVIFQRLDDISKALAHCESLEWFSLENPPEEQATLLAPIQEAIAHYVGAFGDSRGLTKADFDRVQFDYEAFASGRTAEAVVVYVSGGRGCVDLPLLALTNPTEWIVRLKELDTIQEKSQVLIAELDKLQAEYARRRAVMNGDG